MNAQHLTALREAAKALRKVKTDVETVLAAMADERTLLPDVFGARRSTTT